MTDLTLQTLIEFRGEMREFRDEARKALEQHGDRLNLLSEEMRDQSNCLAQLETRMAALLATVRHVHTRIEFPRAPANVVADSLDSLIGSWSKEDEAEFLKAIAPSKKRTPRAGVEDHGSWRTRLVPHRRRNRELIRGTERQP